MSFFPTPQSNPTLDENHCRYGDDKNNKKKHDGISVDTKQLSNCQNSPPQSPLHTHYPGSSMSTNENTTLLVVTLSPPYIFCFFQCGCTAWWDILLGYFCFVCSLESWTSLENGKLTIVNCSCLRSLHNKTLCRNKLQDLWAGFNRTVSCSV